MRLLAESGRKSQFHFFALRFHAVRFPKVHARWKPKKQKKKKKKCPSGRERMWLTHGQIELLPGFCILKLATKENHRNKNTAVYCPRILSPLPRPLINHCEKKEIPSYGVDRFETMCHMDVLIIVTYILSSKARCIEIAPRGNYVYRRAGT